MPDHYFTLATFAQVFLAQLQLIQCAGLRKPFVLHGGVYFRFYAVSACHYLKLVYFVLMIGVYFVSISQTFFCLGDS